MMTPNPGEMIVVRRFGEEGQLCGMTLAGVWPTLL